MIDGTIEVIKKSDLLKKIPGLKSTDEILKAIEDIPTMDVKYGHFVASDWSELRCGIPHWDTWKCDNCGYEHHGDVYSVNNLARCPRCRLPRIKEEEE